ncbi:MAG: four-helix bundle copper-binding protein [Nitrospinae bacterium]|nr:four-helix bundle copper-binding protein [Nitrospinota bacterium]
MDRRELLLAAGGLALTATASKVFGADDKRHEHHHAESVKNAALTTAAFECIRTADICLKHCFEEFAMGNVELAACAAGVNELKIACEALASFSGLGSNHLAAMSKVAMQVCDACYRECRRHGKHQPCLDCADACAKCIDQCKKLAA